MAVGTSTSYFSNAIIGVPQVGADIDIHQVDLTPRFQVGFGFERADGSKYRYSHFGETTDRGLLVGTDLGESSTLAFYTNIGALAVNITRPEGQIMDPNAIGSHYMQIILASAVVHQYAGAYVAVTSGTGLGYTYRIKDNTKTGDPASGDVYLELYKPIVVAIDSNSGLVIAGSPYSDLESTDYSSNPVVSGVTISGATATNYAWICTKGVVSILQDGNNGSKGEVAYLSSATAGTVMALTSTVANISLHLEVGQYIVVSSDANYSVVKLRLE